MKKSRLILLLTSLILFLVSVSYLKKSSDRKSSSRTLNYWHYSPSGGYSLDPKDSDSYLNFVLMYQIVGTLLRSSKDGVYEPFLAESWLVSNEGKTYTFKFKDDLVTSRGKKINAREYFHVFHYLSKYLSSGEGSLIQFDRIVGMDEFLSGKASSISGVQVDDTSNLISFHFFEKPDDILIAFTEPYFGFYNLEDFANNGLRSIGHLDSSGIFELVEVSEDRRSVRIVRRNRSDKSSPHVYDEIFLRLFNNSEFTSAGRDQLIYGAPDLKAEWFQKYKFTNSDPNMLGALVLSPYLEPFLDIDSRKYVRNAIRTYKDQFELKSPRGQTTDHFNFLSLSTDDLLIEKETKKIPISDLAEKNKKVVEVVYFNLLSVEQRWIQSILDKVSEGIRYKLILRQVDRAVPGEMQKVGSDRSYSARFVTVVVGGNASNQNNKMMFCSKLGVNFKDPSSRICKLVHQYERKSGLVDQKYINAFNRIIWEDGVVIPMMQLSFYWMHDSAVNPKVLRFGIGMPRLDLVEFNK